MWKYVILLCCVSPISSYNILGIFPFPGTSHFNFFEPLLKSLASKGHNITVVSYFPQKKSLPNYKDIVIRLNEDIFNEALDLSNLPTSRLKYYQTIYFLQNFVPASCAALKSKEMLELSRTNETYDLILIEMFVTDCFFGFIHKFQAPFIGMSSSVILPWISWRFGNPITPSFIPSVYLPHCDSMNFLERVENFIMMVYGHFQYDRLITDLCYKRAKEVFGDDLPNLDDIASNSSLLLVNSHFSLQGPRPLVTNIIEVGGMFIKNKIKKLPKNIEKWINESTHGVIYFSMGSMIKGHSFPPETRRAFLKAFSRLPQRVLWKWENESLPEQPANVMIQKWMPQFDILCHTNVKAYLSHGGLLGTTEAVHCGVPMVVMPQYGDQFVNAAALQASGGGVILDFKEATEDSIYKALKTILEPSFNKKAKKLSAAFKDRPMPPLETAVYWVEYVARHGGAHYMRTKAVGMPWYQYLLLDVVAFLAFVFFAAVAVLFYTLKIIFRLFKGKAAKTKTH